MGGAGAGGRGRRARRGRRDLPAGGDVLLPHARVGDPRGLVAAEARAAQRARLRRQRALRPDSRDHGAVPGRRAPGGADPRRRHDAGGAHARGAVGPAAEPALPRVGRAPGESDPRGTRRPAGVGGSRPGRARPQPNGGVPVTTTTTAYSAVTEEPFSAEWWRDLLGQRLDAQAEVVALCEAYYNGQHRLSFGTPLWRDGFRLMMQEGFADNWMALVVDSAVERLRVQGFRFGDSTDADDDAWAIWQANNLDLYSRIAHTEAVKTGNAYVLVSPPEDDNDVSARITVEHAGQCVVARDPADPRERLAGLKRWRDLDGYTYATVYLPEQIVRWQTEDRVGEGQRPSWEPRADGPTLTNPLGRVPLIPLENNPQLLTGGRSDLLNVLPIQDAIDKVMADAVVASEYTALRQRWATGVEIPKDDEGNPVTALTIEATFKRLWISENPDAAWGEFSAADLNGYVALVSMLTQHLAALSRTPPHYLLGQIVNASGDALKTAEATLVAKVRAKMVDFSEAWEEVLRCAFLMGGDETRGTAQNAETIWADPESRTEAEHTDALVKQASLGVPEEILWEQMGYSPQTVERMKELKAAEPPPPVPPTAPPGTPPAPPGGAPPTAPPPTVTGG